MKLKHDLGLLPFQKLFLESKVRNLWLCAGIGTGKSHVGALYVIRRMLQDPKGLGLLTASTYKQLNNSVLAHLFKLLDELGLSYNYNSLKGVLTLKATGAKVICASMESYEQLRGIEVSYWVGDEAALYTYDGYSVAIGRVRQKTKLPLEVRLISSPRGFNWTFNKYAEGLTIPYGEIIQKNKTTGIIRAQSSDNKFLPEGYLESLSTDYDENTYRQEVLAEFVAGGSGAVYTSFSRTEHVHDIKDDEDEVLYVGMDFNISPFCAVVSNIAIRLDGTKEIRVFDEIWLENANTYDMAKVLRRRYPNRRIVIAPDATGQARKTSSQKSDHQILREAGFEVKVRGRSNPHKIDRYNTINLRLERQQIKIGKYCKRLITDLEQVTHEKNGPQLTHISDALGYLAWFYIPIKRLTKKSSTTNF